MMSENTPTCQIHDKHPSIKCPNPPLPGEAEGLCILHSQNKNKSKGSFLGALKKKLDIEDYDFQGVLFPVIIDFKEIKKDANFSRATFACVAIFINTHFFGSVDFSHCKFLSDIFFSESTFDGNASFSGATVNGNSYFDKTIFNSNAFFIVTNFNEKTNFSSAIFNRIANFSAAKFNGDFNFRSATINGEIYFQRNRFSNQSNFSYVLLKNQALVWFKDISLAHFTFKGTDLRRIKFHNVSWHNFPGRQALFDEVVLRQNELSFSQKLASANNIATFALELGLRTNLFMGEAPNFLAQPSADEYANVERLYRYLKINFETEQDYKNAGDFHYGEMEMHRRASKWRWFPLYWYNLYWLSSGYGERPLRSVLTLVGLLLAFSGFFLGLEGELLGGWSWAGFGQAFLYVFQQGTLQKPDWLRPATTAGKFLSAVMPVLIPGQAALFLLALRNRLGRRR